MKNNTLNLESEMKTECYAARMSGGTKHAPERSALPALRHQSVLRARAGLWLRGATLVIRAAGAAVLLIATDDPAFAQSWTQTSAPLLSWTAVVSSADGSKLVAVAKDYPNGAV
ncbi:MAG: hypothetical protein NT154_16140 [Verrucomicrobia bacterium]|nr:hypothetical protein [Verrucomicrobiota bacterium]